MDELVLNGVDAGQWFIQVGAVSNPSTTIQGAVARLLVEILEPSAEVANLVSEMPNLSAGHTGLIFPRTKIYIRVRNISNLQVAVFAALLADVITHSSPVAISASVAATIWASVGRLSDEELELFKAFQRLAGVESVYAKWLDQTNILAMYPASERQRAREALAALKAHGVAEDAAGMWRCVL